MTRNQTELEGVTMLGNTGTQYKYDNPSRDILETFKNKFPHRDYIVDWKAPEFTSLCPKTGQPDNATIYIRYIPDERMIESKSLKLYLFAYRNHGDFHEDVVNTILEDIVESIDPKWCRVVGDFYPRGGISIVPIAEHTKTGYVVPGQYLALPDLHKNNNKA